jgi:YHS domain-containing protein
MKTITTNKALAKTLLASLAVVLMLVMGAAPKAFAKSQEICPVMGGKIDKTVYADHEGERVYFCCAGCIGTFEAEPAKFLAIVKKDGVVLDKTPASAPKAPKAPKAKAGTKSHDSHAGHKH